MDFLIEVLRSSSGGISEEDQETPIEMLCIKLFCVVFVYFFSPVVFILSLECLLFIMYLPW